MARSPQMAHKALTPRLLGALRLAPSDGDVSAPEETRVRTQEGPCSPGGLGTETNMSIMRISTAPSQAFSLIWTWVLFPFPQ